MNTLRPSSNGQYECEMNSLVKSIPARWEPILVVAVSLGYFIVSSFSGLTDLQVGVEYVFTNSDAYFLIAYELVGLAFVAWFLKTRGWQVREFGTEVSWILTGGGFLLFFVSFLSYVLTYGLLASILSNYVVLDGVTFQENIAFARNDRDQLCI